MLEFIGWDVFSISIEWLVNFLSVNKKEKYYSPIFYCSVIFTICNIIVSTKIKVWNCSDFITTLNVIQNCCTILIKGF